MTAAVQTRSRRSGTPHSYICLSCRDRDCLGCIDKLWPIPETEMLCTCDHAKPIADPPSPSRMPTRRTRFYDPMEVSDKDITSQRSGSKVRKPDGEPS